MQPIRFLYFVYGSELNPQPLDPGVALYARAWVNEFQCVDLRWDKDSQTWVRSEHLWRLISRGEPDLDSFEAELPPGIPPPGI